MKRWLALAALVLVAGGGLFFACGFVDRPHGSAQVPAAWREVRVAIGHQKHVGKVACADCHGDSFDKPAAELCAKCHAKTSSLHHEDPTTTDNAPACTDCHGYTADTAITPWNCMRCHQDDRGEVGAELGHRLGHVLVAVRRFGVQLLVGGHGNLPSGPVLQRDRHRRLLLRERHRRVDRDARILVGDQLDVVTDGQLDELGAGRQRDHA